MDILFWLTWLTITPSMLDQKNELLSTNKKVIDADVDPPKIDCACNFGQL